MQNQLSSEKLYFKNLDILRFFAAFLVVIAHAYEGWCGWYSKPGFMTVDGNHNNFTPFGNHLDIGIKNGYFGVDIFFLISGFLITYILLSEKEIFGKINIPKFFIRRAFRIWPAYFLLIAVSPFLLKITESPSPDFWPNILFYNNFYAIQIQEWQYPFSHLWSICIEEHFYLLWPFLIAFINKKHLSKVFLSLIVFSILLRSIFFLNHANFLYFYLHTLSRMDVLVLGAYFALYLKENGFKIQTSKFFRIMLYLLFIVFYFSDTIYTYESVFVAALKRYFYCGIVGFAMVNYIFNPKPLFKLSFEKILNYLGKISYGIYLFSNILIPIIVKKFMHKWESQSIILYFVLTIFLTILISIIVYELFEKQFLKIKKRFELIQTSRTA